MSKLDPNVLAHLEWIGFVRPTGLVVSAPALVRAGAILDRRDAQGQHLLNSCIEETEFDLDGGEAPSIPDFRTFAQTVLGWSFSPKGYAGTPESPIGSDLEAVLTEYDETLRPDYAVRDLDATEDETRWQLLVQVLAPGDDLDRVARGVGGLEASPHGRMERLLRRTQVPAGLLFNGRTIRLVSAPRGESSGWIDFHIADMTQTAGRPISTALRLLLNERRLLALPRAQRLAALLDDSRRFQNEVSERLAEQVLHALYELLRGFQSAHDASKGELLREPLAQHPDAVYRALLTVILRLVFLLYAEERDMLPEDETYLQHYSLGGLYERLREDAALFPDTMDQRFGAWAQLLVLFRLVHDGAEAGGMHLPQRHGVLFDPDRFPFVEGRSGGGSRQVGEGIQPPMVPDGTIYRALEKLLVLDGERISYRALDVEQIGSVYETMMGFRLEAATGRSVAVKAQKRHGAPTAVDLEALLLEDGSKRAKWLQDRTDRKLADNAKKAVSAAAILEDLHAALLSVIDHAATPDLVPAGAMVLQPSEERRRSGSHYTPRALTEPIVRTTLDPILERLCGPGGEPPTPAAILDLKVCDPAMGSGAFLVEACRQLGDALVDSWHAHNELPVLPPDEDEVIFARRLIAQRCLYGVDRNPVAVDLAKMSLWLVTLARDHALTFVDHALRHGDSLIGLSRRQIEAFHWEPDTSRFQAGFETVNVRGHMAKVADLRRRIREAHESASDWELRDLWDEAQFELDNVRLSGDLVLAAFFEGETQTERESKRTEYANAVASGEAERCRGSLEEWRSTKRPLAPFHWEIEFPEVFDRECLGFDAIVGNPPFLGGKRTSTVFGDAYLDFLLWSAPESHGNSDLVAFFFRRSYSLIREEGTFGLLATNTINQGDTRASGLRWICNNTGYIYSATRRYRWPGQAAVVVSIVHVIKGRQPTSRRLDGRETAVINAFLFHAGGNDDPARLLVNDGLCFLGFKPYGQGFLFDDDDDSASPLSVMDALLDSNSMNAAIIKPFQGGAELNASPTQSPSRFAIDFGSMSLEEAQKWPQLLAIVEEKVRPQREELKRKSLADKWWLFGERQPALAKAMAALPKVIVTSQTSKYRAFVLAPSDVLYSHKVVVICSDRWACFATLQSRVHELWSVFFGSTMKDDPVYTGSDCFETFPFPEFWETNSALEAAGRAYNEFRSTIMVKNRDGLTTTYNRFHDPDERDPEIATLRELHSAMDRTVLDAYGWIDIPTECEFLLDFEIEEEGSRRRKPWRFRWADQVHDEVLARLLERNAQRAAEEARAGTTSGAMSTKRTATRSVEPAGTPRLFP